MKKGYKHFQIIIQEEEGKKVKYCPNINLNLAYMKKLTNLTPNTNLTKKYTVIGDATEKMWLYRPYI